MKFKDIIHEFINHKRKEYHIVSVQRANDFSIHFEGGGSKAVVVLIDKRKQQVIKSNWKIIVTIIKSILFYEKNNLPLRRHKESDLLSSDTVKSNCLKGVQGISHALLSFRIYSGDAINLIISMKK